MTVIRKFDPERDRDAANTIWQEVGWSDGSSSDQKLQDAFLEGAEVWVGLHEDQPECLVATDEGDMRHLRSTLPFALVTAVTASHIIRRQGLAGRVTAHALAQRAIQGAAVAGLGMFDQGYYDKLGFATGTYEHQIVTAPSKLQVPYATRIPQRLTNEHLPQIVANRLRRRRSHGNLNLPRPGLTEELTGNPKGFGFGFFDDEGQLTHHMWLMTSSMEHGPYYVRWLVYETREQLIELLGFLKNLSDQVDAITMWESDDIQLQQFLKRPFKGMRQTRGARHAHKISSEAWWQARILDLETCIRSLGDQVTGEMRCNLNVHDPITSKLPEDSSWRGVTGDYTLTLQPGEASITPGHTEGLEVLCADVGPLTRWWLGVSSAWGTSAQPGFEASEGLLDAIDAAIRIPTPKIGWQL